MPPPASAFKKAPKKEELPLTAVVILDSFDQRYAPILGEDKCFGFLPMCNVPMINYTMSWLMRTEVKNILLVVSGKSAKYGELVRENWQLLFDQYLLVVCDGATSVGDCLREIHNRELITSDFLLISNPSAMTSSNLSQQICAFRKRRQENADNVMTLIYGACENRDKSVIGVNGTTKKLHLYPSATSPGVVKVDKPDFYEGVEIRRDVVNSEIALCSRLIATQFSDNFDFQTVDDVIREILSKDDILGLSIHVDILPQNEAAYSACDYDSLLQLNTLLLERWFYPLTPEKADVNRFISVCPRNVYVENDNLSVSRLSTRTVLDTTSFNVSLGKSCKVASSSKLINVSVGESSKIGENSRIINCIIGKSCEIGANCQLDGVFIGDNVRIADGTQLLNSDLVIGNDTNLEKRLEIASQSAICASASDEENLDRIVARKLEGGVYGWTMRNGFGTIWKKHVRNKAGSLDDDEEASEDGDDDEDDAFGDVADATRQFYEEVVESMKGMMAMSDQQMANLILEINSSKLACNVTMEEVARNVFAAFLSLPGNDDLKTLLTLIKTWRPLFLNYYKSSDEALAAKSVSQRKVEVELKRKCQIQMLLAIEDRYERDAEVFGPKVAKLVHFLYNDADVLDEEAILEWAKTISEKSKLKQIMQPIVDWLMEDDESEEDSD